MKSLFFGGAHPDDRKELSASSVPAVRLAPAGSALMLFLAGQCLIGLF